MSNEGIVEWYAIRTAPGAQHPRREYVAEKTRSRKGYRIVPSLNPSVSAIEKALTDAGFVHYMPAEKRLMKDRLRPYLWKHRRFPLMVGYVFVRIDAIRGWAGLSDVPGVAGIVRGPDNAPLRILFREVMEIRSAEAQLEADFDRDSRLARQKIRRAAKDDPSLRAIVEKLDIAGTITVSSGVNQKAA